MSFTDEDLAEMIERLDPDKPDVLVGYPIQKWRDLIARLEAAEDLIFADQDSYDEKFEAWKKAAGKP